MSFYDRKPNFSEIDIIGRTSFGTSSESGNESQFSNADIEKVGNREVLFDVEEIQREFLKIEALIPVCDFGWEGYQTLASDAGRAVTLAREIAEDLDLINCPQEFDFFTKGGTRASLNVSDHSDDFNNNQSLFFIRKDLLDSYLQHSDSSLVWVIWGERRYSWKRARVLFSDQNCPDKTHGDIWEVRRYEL